MKRECAAFLGSSPPLLPASSFCGTPSLICAMPQFCVIFGRMCHLDLEAKAIVAFFSYPSDSLLPGSAFDRVLGWKRWLPCILSFPWWANIDVASAVSTVLIRLCSSGPLFSLLLLVLRTAAPPLLCLTLPSYASSCRSAVCVCQLPVSGSQLIRFSMRVRTTSWGPSVKSLGSSCM